jgi:hypothetical protein
MKDTLRLLLFHMRMLPCAVTIASNLGAVEGYARASNLVNLVSLMKILIIFLIIKARAQAQARVEQARDVGKYADSIGWH